MQLQMINRRQSFKLIIVVLVLNLLNSCRKFDHDPPPTATDESADVLYDWYKLGAKMQLYTMPGPNVIANNRSFGYIGVGVYESVRPGIKGAVSLSDILYQMPSIPSPDGHGDYLWGASANAAMASMYRQFLFGLTDANMASIDSLETAYSLRFRSNKSDDVINRSEAYGRMVANIIYNWSTSDNFNLSAQGYDLPVFPGSYELTPPNFPAPVGPFLKNSRPFLQSTASIIPPAPLTYSEDTASAFYKAAREVYDVSFMLTDEIKASINFWADAGGPGVGVPGPAHIISIITSVLKDENAKLPKAAEIYAKTGIAFKDAFYGVWRIKFQYNLLRPITYIQKHIDSTWQSYLITPPYPDYPSGLAGIYTPSMQILIREFGDVPVTDDTYVFNGSQAREFNSISEIIEQAAISRLYAGIHYRFTQDYTVIYGKELGNMIANINLIRPSKY